VFFRFFRLFRKGGQMSYLELAKQIQARYRGETGPPVPAPDPAAVAEVLALPLCQLHCVLEVRVPWWPVSLWFVPGEIDVEGLLGEGVSRGRIWTVSELLDLLAIGASRPQLQTVAHAKLAFGGEVTIVRQSGAHLLRGQGE
jgi:hypothetical protein